MLENDDVREVLVCGVRTDMNHQTMIWWHGEACYLPVGVTMRNCGQVVVDPSEAKTEVQLPTTSHP